MACWDRAAVPALPTQWLEETIVEAFSIRGLALLAQSWALNPPFAGDEKFAGSLRTYRQDLVAKYRNNLRSLRGIYILRRLTKSG